MSEAEARFLGRIGRKLSKALEGLKFRPPVAYVYNPLQYASQPYNLYNRLYARKGCPVILLGMNPGPFGMAQTGVPFGDVVYVRSWLKIHGKVGKPPREHPKRPVLGFDCPRREVSGARLWGWAAQTFGTPERFFRKFFVLNYCPLLFLEESGKNRTPDKVPRPERDLLLELCDKALRESIEYLKPKVVLGIGNFSFTRAKKALQGLKVEVGRVLHPSPQSPAANRGWAEAFVRDLARYGIKVV